MKIDNLTLIGGSAAAVLTYFLWKAIYNLYFHPLAKFPGPWWATTSYLPQFYYEVVKGGRYYIHLIEMHEKYGPLVRMNPDELHFNDPFFYDQVYAGNPNKTNKEKTNARLAGLDHSTSTTIDHDHHRRRRGYVSTFFSKQSTLRMESFIQSKVDKLLKKLRDGYESGSVYVSVEAFGALTTDVITQYAYGESFNELDKPGLTNPLTGDVKSMLLSGHFRRFLPVVAQILQSLPESFLRFLFPVMGRFLDIKKKMAGLSDAAHEQVHSGKKAVGGKTIFDALMDPSVPPEEQTRKRLEDENIALIFAGIDTTARYLAASTCYMATYPEVTAKLRAELKTMWVDINAPPTLSQLESLPYLTGFINETLRYQCIMTSHFPRVPQQPIQYKDWVIPAGTSIGAKPWLLNNHPDTFPDPHAFRPERWIEAEERGEFLTRYLFTFTKGSRICLGIPLAYAELYLAIAGVVRNFDLELVNSSIKDITLYHDMGMNFNEDYNYGVNFKVSKVLEEQSAP